MEYEEMLRKEFLSTNRCQICGKWLGADNTYGWISVVELYLFTCPTVRRKINTGWHVTCVEERTVN